MASRYLLRGCDAVGISPRVSDMLRTRFRLKPSRVHTIENGVDLALFGEARRSARAVRDALGLSPDDIVIGQVANFKKNKNHLFLLKAFDRIARQRSNVKLLFAGRGFDGDRENSEAEIQRFVQENGLGPKVRIVGYRPDVHELLGAVDIFCLVSHREGLPLSLVEAMASGLPVVGTCIDGVRSVVEPDVNGFLVAPDDVEGLTARLSMLIEDEELRHRMGLASKRIGSTRYSLARCVEQTQQVFLSQRRPALPSATAQRRIGSPAAKAGTVTEEGR
jgi:glycosyltransferase involved in cell wall biosynthesis